MQLTRVAMCDFRSFQGLHEIDLSPRTKYGAKRPIVLFGGLNGAGKTTILTAVRLALYGKLILGNRAGRKDYETLLEESIHKNPMKLMPADSAYVELEFDYGKLGERLRYRVQRSWIRKTASVEERLRIWRDGAPLRGVDREDAQAFLNELVPLGVSDLFFFDGEKIAELAEDNDGSALRDAIRRLVGIDLTERLSADLGIYLRRGTAAKADERERRRLQILKSDYETARESARELSIELSTAEEQLAALDAGVEKTEHTLVAMGGRWAEGRATEQDKINTLMETRRNLEIQLRDFCAGLMPLSLAREALGEAIDAADAEQAELQQILLAQELRALTHKLLPEAETALSRKGAAWLQRRLESEASKFEPQVLNDPPKALYEANPREISSWRHALTEFVPESIDRANEIAGTLVETNDRLDVAGIRVARAPEEASVEAALSALRAAQKKREAKAISVAAIHAECKQAYRQALQHGRELKRAESQLSDRTANERPMEYARRIRALLANYGQQIAEAKVQDLENEFAAAFRRLARKDDLHVHTRIDPDSYQVTLVDESSNRITRAQLSAGERQIYAIAMLEALAHTSGRRLPVIIDTPLGRLDSKHRAKLVNHYFPRASHQVLILSTDTEVDQGFYQELSPEISHAFEIGYDPATRSSSLNEGYFWRTTETLKEAS